MKTWIIPFMVVCKVGFILSKFGWESEPAYSRSLLYPIPRSVIFFTLYVETSFFCRRHSPYAWRIGVMKMRLMKFPLAWFNKLRETVYETLGKACWSFCGSVWQQTVRVVYISVKASHVEVQWSPLNRLLNARERAFTAWHLETFTCGRLYLYCGRISPRLGIALQLSLGILYLKFEQ